MTTVDWKQALLSIQRCNAVYIVEDLSKGYTDAGAQADAFQAFVLFGSKPLARLSTTANQAILSFDPNGDVRLTISGTRASEGPFTDRATDVSEDIRCELFHIGSGRHVAKTPFQEAEVIYTWALNTLSKLGLGDRPLHIEGHSLGGWKATYSSEYVPLERILSVTAWESPKQGDDAYWQDLEERGFLDKLTQFVHGADLWASWPWAFTSLNKGRVLVWIHNGTFTLVTEADWPGGMNWSDHGPTSVVDAVKALAAQQALVAP